MRKVNSPLVPLAVLLSGSVSYPAGCLAASRDRESCGGNINWRKLLWDNLLAVVDYNVITELITMQNYYVINRL